MSLIYKRLSELKDEELVQAVLERFRADYDFREEVLDGGGFEKCAKLFEARSTDTDEDGIPHVNLIRRAVEDYLAVTLPNIPKAQLYAHRFLPGRLPEWERVLRMEVINEAEVVMNVYIKTILKNNEYNDKAELAVWFAAIFGVGYLKIALDRSNDLRQSFELREIMAKDELTPEDMDRLEILKNRIAVNHIDSRDVWFEAGKRIANDEMLRVSYIERQSTHLLQEEYGDAVEDPNLIQPGKFPHGIEDTIDMARNNDDSQTAVLTMFELEPVEKVRVISGPDGEEVEIPFTDWNLVKVVIAGGQLVEKEVTTGIPDTEEGEEPGPLRLPIIPFYIKESLDHPYGFSIPLMLALSEKFINGMRAIIYKAARKAVTTQGVVVAIPNLGDGDLEELEYALEEGGVARIKGNTQGPFDIKDMVMPLNYNAAPINPVLMQSVDMEMSMFRAQSQAVDPDELRSARTGAGKRAQMSATDRPKGLAIAVLAKSIEEVWESVHELVRIFHNQEIGVEIEVPGGGREYIVLNELYERNVLVQAEEFASPENPRGFGVEKFSAKLNSTSVTMYAEAEGRGKLPLDMIARFQILVALQQAQIIEPETVRRLALDDEIKDIDDVARRKRQEQEAQMQQAMFMTQMMDNPEMQQVAGNALGQPQGEGIMPQEVARDANQMAAQPIFG